MHQNLWKIDKIQNQIKIKKNLLLMMLTDYNQLYNLHQISIQLLQNFIYIICLIIDIQIKFTNKYSIMMICIHRYQNIHYFNFLRSVTSKKLII